MMLQMHEVIKKDKTNKKQFVFHTLWIINSVVSFMNPVRCKPCNQCHWGITAISSDLHNESMCFGGLGLWWDMLLNSLTWPPHSQQNESVGKEDDCAGQCIAKDKKADNVRQSWKLMVGCMPVNAAGCAIWFSTVMPPLCQGPHSKHRSIAPNSSHQEAGMWGGKLVPWKRRHKKRLCSY